MLLRLSLRDFVIVDQATLEFSSGFNVLTGETGAGKSILCDALAFLAGGRSGAEWIRRGAEQLVVEGAFQIAPELRVLPALAPLLEGEDLLILRRELGVDGRSRCFANGRQVLVSQLRELTRGLLWSVGQGEQRALTASSEQEWLLDRYGATLDLRREYRELRARLLRAATRLAALQSEREGFAQEEDWLRFQENEIRAAAISPGERARLNDARQNTRALEKELALRQELAARLYGDEGSILDHVESLAHLLSHADAERWAEVTAGVLALRETARELRRMVESRPDLSLEEVDPEAIEERLRLLDRLCRKYGGDEAAVEAHRAEVAARLQAGERLSAEVEEAERALRELRASLGRSGDELSRRRREAAGRFAAAVGRELAPLGLPGASLEFRFGSEQDGEGVLLGGVPVRPLENGLERTTLLFRSHPGEAEGELGRIASGGELSRVLLGLHVALGEAGPPGCWVLDEIDQGIGGETAIRVAERLERMARRAQVLLVTHLPAIAARAERHLLVRKREVEGRATAEVEALPEEARVTELARMLSGRGSSEIARRHARELLEAARSQRQPHPGRGGEETARRQGSG
jgi:DNA repair protein RecN (Recombination protein N)